MQPDILELMSLDRPAQQLFRIRSVYSLDMRGKGKDTLAKAESLLTMHHALCMQAIDK
ncbi:hypothetical protein [Xanthomonas phage L522]|nr:hypothetical protein [Xanthomonas phage L522]